VDECLFEWIVDHLHPEVGVVAAGEELVEPLDAYRWQGRPHASVGATWKMRYSWTGKST